MAPQCRNLWAEQEISTWLAQCGRDLARWWSSQHLWSQRPAKVLHRLAVKQNRTACAVQV